MEKGTARQVAQSLLAYRRDTVRVIVSIRAAYSMVSLFVVRLEAEEDGAEWRHRTECAGRISLHNIGYRKLERRA